MKIRASRQMTRHIALAGGLVMLFAGCQVSTPTQNAADPGVNTGTSRQTPGKTADNGTPDVPTPQAQANASVTGTVTDTDGKPIAGVEVNTYDGFKATTDDQGKFSIDAVGQDELRLDFSKEGYLLRQVLTGVPAGMSANVDITMKPLDAKLTHIDGSKGGTAVNSDGSSILEVPPGAIEGNADIRLTWMNPMPSDKFPTNYGELPGPPVTKTNGDGTDAGDVQLLNPLGFTTVDVTGGKIAPGAQITLKMKVTPEALAMYGKDIDFNNPATLQQPCYEYDRASGLWVNPATSKLEKDADGTVWYVYTLHGQDSPKNLKILSHVSGQKTVYWTTQEARTGVYYTTVSVGGYTYQKANYYTYYVNVTHSKQVDLYGKHFDGTVKERSSNSAFNGQGISGATVYHGADFYGMTSTSTGGNGGYDIPMWHNSNGVNVSGSTWRGANSTGGGYNMIIPTDGNVTADIKGGSLTYSASNSNLSTGSWSGSIDKVASRDSKITINEPASPLYIAGNPDLSKKVPVKGTAAFGTLKVVKDLAGQVIEEVHGTDNAQTPHQADGSGLDGVTITNFTDAVTGDTSATTAGGGKFKFTIYGNANDPTVHADFKSFVSGDGASAPYRIVLNTDSTLTLDLKNGQSLFADDTADKPYTVKYTVDGVEYSKTATVGTDGKFTLTFCRDKTDNRLEVVIKSVESADMIAVAPFPSATLVPHGTAEKDVTLKFKAGAVKYRN